MALMLDLTTVPAWSLPAVILFIFALGVGVQKIRHGSITSEQLKAAILDCRNTQSPTLERRILQAAEKSIDKCKATQGENFTRIDTRIEGLTRERQEIWNIVRVTEKHTAVIISEIAWLKDSLGDVGELKQQLGDLNSILKNISILNSQKGA